MKKHSGFTLLELMVTVAIAGIVMAFAVPALETFVKNDRLTTQINSLVSHLSYARNEAVTRSQQVGLCASDDSSSATPSCSGNDWADGWILFVDLDGDSGFTVGETVLRVKTTLEGNNTLSSSSGNLIIYDYRGFTPNLANATFSLCDDRGVTEMKSISISNTGRVQQGGGAAC